jgi:uncharacterized protein
MIHPNTEIRFISQEKGYGVVATKFIPKGTITWVLDKFDSIFTLEEIESLPSAYQDVLSKYAYRNRRGDFVLCWDSSKFVNHSYNSNCLTTAYEFELAVRDIHPGDELTDDYGYLNISEPFYGIPEQGSKRKVVYPDDILNFHKTWDRKLHSAFKNLNKVEQPLSAFMENKLYQKALRISLGEEQMDSILNCYYNENGSSTSTIPTLDLEIKPIRCSLSSPKRSYDSN